MTEQPTETQKRIVQFNARISDAAVALNLTGHEIMNGLLITVIRAAEIGHKPTSTKEEALAEFCMNALDTARKMWSSPGEDVPVGEMVAPDSSPVIESGPPNPDSPWANGGGAVALVYLL